MDSNFTATHPNIDESRMQPASIKEGFDETEIEGSENSQNNEETIAVLCDILLYFVQKRKMFKISR